MSTFVDYLKNNTQLEVLLEGIFKEANIDPEKRGEILSFLAPLKTKGPIYRFHYDHTIRVALLCVAVAKFMHLDRKALAYAGLLHDVGKALVSPETLGKTSGWTEKDTREMRPHVMDGYKLLRGKFNFTAEVILWHHRYQKNGYPGVLPKALHPYCLGSKTMIQMYGRILSLCDQFDAFHRVNDKQGALVIPTGEEIKQYMLVTNADQRALLTELYDAEVFTTFTEVPREVTRK